MQASHASPYNGCTSTSQLQTCFTNQIVKLARSIAVGDPGNPRTVVGPMIDEQAARKIESWIREATEGGARVLCGGGRTGAVLEPTVLADVASGDEGELPGSVRAGV